MRARMHARRRACTTRTPHPPRPKFWIKTPRFAPPPSPEGRPRAQAERPGNGGQFLKMSVLSLVADPGALKYCTNACSDKFLGLTKGGHILLRMYWDMRCETLNLNFCELKSCEPTIPFLRGGPPESENQTAIPSDAGLSHYRPSSLPQLCCFAHVLCIESRNHFNRLDVACVVSCVLGVVCVCVVGCLGLSGIE